MHQVKALWEMIVEYDDNTVRSFTQIKQRGPKVYIVYTID